MATLRILVPEGTTNFIKNPSARYDVSGWNAVGATLTRTMERARFGIASFQVVTNGSALYEGIYYRVNSLSGISDPITVSAYLRGTGSVRLRLIDNPFGQERATLPVTLRADRWTRVEVTGQSTGSNDVRLYVETDQVRAVTFYVDGAQMERKPYSTTYCDGDQESCRWNVMKHNSQSIRDPYTRAGGRWVELAGPERRAEDLYMTVVGGLGMASVANNTQPYAISDGSYFQNAKVTARPITLTFHAKHEHRRPSCSPVTLAHLHGLRQMLIDIIKPRKTRGDEEFTLEYTDGDTSLYLKARYDGGLEGDWDVRNEWINSFPLRLLAVSPYFYEDDQEVTSLDFQEAPDANWIMARVDGEWGNMNYGLNNRVSKLVTGARGELIAVGLFTRANSDASAIDPLLPANHIASWNGEKWNQYGIGADSFIESVAVAPNGYVYVVGFFTSIGGVAANGVAYWNGSTWNAMGAGLGGTGSAIAVAPNGDVYVGGAFVTAGGNPAYYIARWDGSSWHTLGPNKGLNSVVLTIAIDQSGTYLYAGGGFSDEFSNPGLLNLSFVARYDITAGTWDELGDGLNNFPRILKISPSGILYAGGTFTITIKGQIYKSIAYWNGSTWQPLGDGMDGTITGGVTSVWGLDIGVSRELIAVGDFTEAGDVDANGVAIWNGSTWTNLDVVSNAYTIPSVLYDSIENIYLGVDAPVHVGGITSVKNTGTAEVNPKIYIQGPATLKYIENYTARKRAFFDLDILAGEEVFIDFGRAKVDSSVRGDLAYTVKPGSDLHAFTLLPGDNKIIAFMVNDTGAQMSMMYTPKNWSGDSTQKPQDL